MSTSWLHYKRYRHGGDNYYQNHIPHNLAAGLFGYLRTAAGNAVIPLVVILALITFVTVITVATVVTVIITIVMKENLKVSEYGERLQCTFAAAQAKHSQARSQ